MHNPVQFSSLLDHWRHSLVLIIQKSYNDHRPVFPFSYFRRKFTNKMNISPLSLQSIGMRTQFPSLAYAAAASHATDTTSTVTPRVRRTKRVPPPNYSDTSDDDSDSEDKVEVVGGRGHPYAAAEALATSRSWVVVEQL